MSIKEYRITNGNYRPYSQECYNKADKIGKETAIIMLEQYGWKCIDDSEKYKLGDLIVEKNGIKKSFEIEVRQGSWKKGPWPKAYNTIHFPPRKANSPVDYFITFNEVLDHAIIVKGSIVRSEKNRDVVDAYDHIAKQINKSHSFVDVPLEKSGEIVCINEKWKVIRRPIIVNNTKK